MTSASVGQIIADTDAADDAAFVADLVGENERRISLTFEYLTDARMGRWRRFISNMKDAIAYFDFKQVFKRSRRS